VVDNDPLLIVLRYVPIAFVIAGVLLVLWLSGQRLPHEWHNDVLDALSESEPLGLSAIRNRPPLAHQELDLRTLEQVLDHLCHSGQAVRWFEPVGPADPRREPVYRRVGQPRP
jgi:hypothetical protein